MPEAQPSTPTPDDVPLDHDHPCGGCGYNLRGLDRTGGCPECGESIAQSLSNRLLAGADPAWVLRVYRGADLILWAVLATIALPFGGGCLASIFSDMGMNWRAVAWALLAWLAVGWILAAIGTWLLTTPANDTQSPYPHPALGLTARLGIALGPAMLIIFLLGQMYAIGHKPSEQFFVFTLFGGVLLLGVGKTTLYLCFRQLAKRMKDPFYATSSGLLAGLIAMGSFIFFLLFLPIVIDTHGYWPDGGTSQLMACTLPLIIIITMIWQLALTAAFRSRLRQALPHRFHPKRENNFGAGAM